MAKRTVELLADSGIFLGLAKQNMLFHQCIGELVDNSIAQKKETEKFKIEVIFHRPDSTPESIRVYISDAGKGMSAEKLGEAIQLGRLPDIGSRLHEHGFGLKNALATLTAGTGFWKIYSKDSTTGKVSSVEAPFGRVMDIEDDDAFPNADYEGVITVSIGSDRVKVPPVQVPLGTSETKYFTVELQGKTYSVVYRFGTLDETKRTWTIRIGRQFLTS